MCLLLRPSHAGAGRDDDVVRECITAASLAMRLDGWMGWTTATTRASSCACACGDGCVGR